MRKTILTLTAIAIFIVLLAGCQPTPEEPVVIQKDLEQMIEKAQTTPGEEQANGVSLREQTRAPETLTMESEAGKFTLSVDASVSVPEAYSMPVIRTTAGEFTQEQVEAIWDTLVGDTVLFRRDSTGMSREELVQTIIDIKQYIADHENDPDYAEYIGQSREELERVEARYNSAPEEIGIVEADSTLRKTEYEDEGTTYMSAGGSSEGNTMGFEVKNTIKDNSGYTIVNASMDFYTEESYHNFGQVGTITVDEDTQLNEDVKQYKHYTGSGKENSRRLLRRYGHADAGLFHAAYERRRDGYIRRCGCVCGKLRIQNCLQSYSRRQAPCCNDKWKHLS